MSRPAFSLTDDQARTLVQSLAPILDQHPIGARSHRPFVRAFVRAVHQATGRTFSPVIYQRLLDAFAPGRKPSSDTLAQEKAAFEAALDEEARAGRELDAGTGIELATVIQRALQAALASTPIARGSDVQEERALAQVDFLQAQLSSSEKALQQVRAHAAQVASELHAAHAVIAQLTAERDKALAEVQTQTLQATTLAHEVAEQRRYAVRVMDDVRGETRAVRERCAHLESQLQAEKRHTEYFRQAAYARGATIPAELRPQQNKT